MGQLANLNPSTKDSQWDLIFKIAAALRTLVTGGGSGSSGGAVANATSKSTALEASRAVAAGASGIRCFTISGFNNRASDQWIMVFDAAAVPADGTVQPVGIILAPAGYQFSFNWPGGRPFTAGVAVCNSTTINTGTNITKTIGSADCQFDINYRG